MHTRIQEKGAVSPQETEPDLPMRVQESPAEAWVDRACCGVRAEYTLQVQVLVKEVAVTAMAPAIVWPEAKQQGVNTPPHQWKVGLKIY